MKKILALVMVLCMVFALCACGQKTEADPAGEAEETQTEENTDIEFEVVDYDSIFALHSPDEVVMTVDGKDVTWQQYFYPYYYNASTIESYMYYYTMYGQPFGWGDDIGDGTTYADSVILAAEDTLKQYASVEGVAAINEIEMDEEGLQALEERHQNDLESIGPGTTEEQFAEALEKMYISYDIYEQMNTRAVLYDKVSKTLFGENGEKLDNADVIQWVEDNGYMAANHILFRVDDSMDEAAVAELEAKCQAICDELKAIKKDADRLARFLELKIEMDEDTGKETYPNGYVFTEGKMVTEFEDAAKELGAYEVSDPVKSTYGFHIMMGMPVDIESVLSIDEEGNEVTVGQTIIAEKLAQLFQDYYDQLEVKYVDGFKPPMVSDYLTKLEE